MYAEDKIDIDSFKQIQNVTQEKLDKLNKKLNSLPNYEQKEEININLIKEIVTNLKDNFLHLSNRERKMFLERFVKEIKVEKVGGDVVINEINF